MDQKKKNTLMSFSDHFDELRVRFIKCLLIFFIGFILFYFTSESLLAFLRKPLFSILPIEQQKLYFTHLFENLITHLKIAGVASLFFFSPLYFYQLWAFITPGLHEVEKKKIIPFSIAAAFFFVGGACFAYFVLFPIGFHYFLNYGAPTDTPMLTIDSYYGTCLNLLLLFGIAFEFPVFICLLGLLGVVDACYLRKQRKTAILFITFISAFFAPPDAISMLILGIPLVFFYEGAIWFVHFIKIKKNPL